MNLTLASMDPVLATFFLSLAVLLAGVVLAWKALASQSDTEATKQVFAVVGVLFGLLAAGGLGTLFANQAAETAENAAENAGTAAATKVSGEVSGKIEELQGSEKQGGKAQGKSAR